MSCQTFKAYNNEISYVYASTSNPENYFVFFTSNDFIKREKENTLKGKWGKNGSNIQIIYQDENSENKQNILVISYNQFKFNEYKYKKLTNKELKIWLENNNISNSNE
jgi:hypothetical protein